MVAPTVDALSGPQLREMFGAATDWLERHIQQVNAVNVFPVPDGDTGTNMYLTMRSTMEEAWRCDQATASAMLAAMSHGALMGARGNSGVILSQIIRGMAQAADGADVIDPATLASGLEQGSTAAYRAVTKPAEGTILTVVRETSVAVRDRLAGVTQLQEVLEIAVRTAKESVQRTPTLLPALAEAGVVDAGGLGLSIIIEGMLRHLRGDTVEEGAATADSVQQDWLAATSARHDSGESLYGYCTELLVEGAALNADAIRDRMMELGDSVLVVGDERMVRVHVHTDDPGSALTHCTGAGGLTQVKVDNIRSQAEQFVGMHEDAIPVPAEPQAISSVAVVAGDGMARVFHSVGCTRIISGGPTMNPSTRDIVEAIEACPSDDVVVLPNDKNIILAAQQALEVVKKRVRIARTQSMPQGIAALLALNQDDSLDDNLEVMEAARESVRTVEVTRAVRSTRIGGVAVREGDIIAIIDDELSLTAATAEEAVEEALGGLATSGGSLVTLYFGGETDIATADALAIRLRESLPAHEVEVVYGGQPHYDYIASLE